MKTRYSYLWATKGLVNFISALSCLFVVSGQVEAAPLSATALPTNGQVAAGSAAIVQDNTNASAPVLNVNQTSQRAVVNWNTFDVGSAATVNFNQANAQSSTLNRVSSPDASRIMGKINAPGEVVLVNQSGVYFGKTANVDVGAMTATTSNISDADYMAGNVTYDRNGATGKVVNKGTIQASLAGYVALLAPEVRNSGVIVAQMGTVVLAAGDRVTLNFDPSRHLASITATPSTVQALIDNKNAVKAPGGLIILSANAVSTLTAGVIKQSGTLTASADGATLTNKGGRILLSSGTVKLQAGSQTLARGPAGGGDVEITATKTVTVDAGARVSVLATQTGNGGTINIQSGEQTTINGTLSAQGGKQSGDGGTITTASAGQVQIGSTAEVNAGVRGTSGNVGTWNISAASVEINSTNAPVISQSLNRNNVNIRASVSACQAAANCAQVTSSQNPAGQTLLTADAVIQKTSPRLTTLTLTAQGDSQISTQIVVNGQILSSVLSPLTLEIFSDNLVTLNQNSALAAQIIRIAAESGAFYGDITSYFNGVNTFPLATISLFAGTISIGGSARIRSAGGFAEIDVEGEHGVMVGPNVLIAANGDLGGQVNIISNQGLVDISGVVQTNGSAGPGGTMNITASQINLVVGSQLVANGMTDGGSITFNANQIGAMNIGGLIQTNGGTGRGGSIVLGYASDISLLNATLQANAANGGQIQIIANSGDLNIQTSLIQTNGSTGRGGSVGLSAQNNVTITNSEVDAIGFNQGGTIKIGNDATNGTLPFALSTSIDASSIIDAQASHGLGGFIETSGHTLNLLGSINAGRGGMWLLDPNSLIIDSTTATSIQNGLTSNVTIQTTSGIVCTGATCSVAGYGSSGNISILSAISTTNTGTLKFVAAGSIVIDANISIGGQLIVDPGSNKEFVIGLNLSNGAGITISANGGFVVNDNSSTGITSYITGNITTNNNAITFNSAVQVVNFGSSNPILISSQGANISLPGSVSNYSGNFVSYAEKIAGYVYDLPIGSGNSTNSAGYINTVTGSSTDVYFQYNSSATFTVIPGISAIQYLVVGGGGGGGGDGGTGGGGGGFINNTSSTSVSLASTVSIVVGTGGNPGGWAIGSGTNGGASSISIAGTTYTANGGNYGGVGPTSTGGSGGTASSGYTGGAGGGSSGGTTGHVGASGANGNASSITGSSTYYGGGGGGGIYLNPTSYAQSAGGAGGGGSGVGGMDTTVLTTGINGAANLGGGGGSGSASDAGTNTGSGICAGNGCRVSGGYGGSGVVIVRTSLGASSNTNTPSLSLSSGAGSVTMSSTVSGLTALTITSNNASNSISGVLSGATNLTFAGSGSTTLSANNTFTGSTTVNANATLNLTPSGNFSETLTGGFVNNGTVSFDGSSGGGAGAGTSGISINGASGSGTWNITNATSSTTQWNNRFLLYGSITTSGQMTVNNNGNLWLQATTTTSANTTSAINLNGANTYLRVYGVASGTIAIGALTGSGTVDFSDGGGGTSLTLSVGNDNGTGTFSGIIKNSGASSGPTVLGLTKAGTGTQTLSGANTYSGTTTISGGTLQIGAGGAVGNLGTGGVVNNAALVYNLSSPITESNLISGSGTLTQSGSGALTLSANNTYTGSTTISSGSTLVIGGTGSLGALSTSSSSSADGVATYVGTISNAGSFYYSSSADQVLSGVISGVGTLTKDTGSTSTLTLAAANTYSGATTITAGYLAQAVANALSSSSDVTVNANGTLNLSGYSATIGSLSGAGNIINSRNISQNSLVLYFDPSNVLSYSGSGATTLYNLVNSSSAGSGNNATFNVGYTGGGGITYSGGVLNLNNNCTANCSSSNSNYLTLANTGLSNFSNGISIISQVNFGPASSSTWARLIDFGNTSGSPMVNILFARNGTSSDININTGNASLGVTGGITNSQLTNYAFTMTSGGTPAVYLSGVAATISASGSTGTSAIPTNTNRTYDYIGHSNWASDGSLNGSLGVFLLYSSAQSAAQVIGANNEISRSLSAATLTYGTASNATFSGKILNGNAAIGLVKQGSGTSTLSNTSTYTGGTTINGGTLSISAASNINSATGGLTLGGGTLLLTGTSTTATLTSDVTLTAGTSSSLAAASGDTLKLNGNIGTSTGALVIGSSTNTGTVVLGGTNSYTGGTTVNGGTLVASSASALGGSTGGLVTLNGSSKFDLQFAGTLTLGSLSMASGSSITNSTSNSGLTVNGISTLSNAVTTTNGQIYAGAVTLGASTTLTGSTITTNSTVAGGSNALTITGNLSTADVYSGLTSLSVSGKTTLGANVTTTGVAGQAYNGDVVLINPSITLASSGNPIAFAGNISTQIVLQLLGGGSYLFNGVTSTLTNGISQNLIGGNGTILWNSSNSTYTYTPSATSMAQVLVVGGGGGGGLDGGGGGGAGGFVQTSSNAYSLSGNTAYSVVVGNGGSGATGYGPNGNWSGGASAVQNETGGSGGTSCFGTNCSGSAGVTTLIATGGGGGSTKNYTGANGASGGGTGNNGSSAGTASASGASAGQLGNNGGASVSGWGGGGGGSGSAGIAATSSAAGNGGSGTQSSITGSANYYAAGGGGGQWSGSSITTGSGGSSIGGNGGGYQAGNNNVTIGGNAVANTGSGGGGGGSTIVQGTTGVNGSGQTVQAGSGGNGASGIVVLNVASSLTINAGAGQITFASSKTVSNISLSLNSSYSAGNGNTVTSVIGGANNSIAVSGGGLFTLSGANTYSGGTTISAGTLQVGAGSTSGNLGTGGVINNASLIYNRSDTITDSNNISGTGTVTQAGTGTLTLSGSNSYTGGTILNAGTLNLGSANAIGSSGTITFGNSSGSITGGGILQYSSSNTTDYSSRFSSAIFQTYLIDTNGQSVTLGSALSSNGGTLIKLGSGILTLGATNTYVNGSGTQIYGGVLQVSSDANLGNSSPVMLIGGALLATSSFSTSKNIQAYYASGGVIEAASGVTLTLTGSISGTTVNIGGFATGGTYTGTIVYAPSGGSLTNLNLYAGILLNSSSYTNGSLLTVYGGNIAAAAGTTVTFSNTVAGSVAINIGDAVNTGTVLLSSTSNSFSAGVNVNYGTLSVSAQTNVPSGNTITLTNGATLLDTANSVTLANPIALGTGGGVIAVNGSANTLTLSGAMTGASTNAVQFGTSTNAGTIALTTTAKAFTGAMTVSAATVNLSSTLATTTIGISGNGTLAITGGGYNRLAFTSNITINNGTLSNTQTGTGGIGQTLATGAVLNLNGNATVSLSGVGDTWGSLSIQGPVINSTGSGNSINGGALAIYNTGLTINVATATSLTISSIMENSNGTAGLFTKTGAGTLILTGANTYSGGTTISAGTIQVGSGSTAGVLGTGGVINNAALTYNRSDAITDSNTISGTGTVTQNGSGTLTLGGNNTYTGVTTVNAGILTNAASTSTKTSGFIINNGGTYKIASTGGFPNNPTNGYTFVVNSGGTLDLNGVGWLDGGSTGYAIQLNGGTLANNSATAATVTMSYSPTRDIVLTNTSIIGGTGNITLNGVISGAYSLLSFNSGVVVLGGANTYSGGTSIYTGTVQISSDGNLGAAPGTAATNITLSGGGLLVSGQSTPFTISATRGIALGTGTSSISNANTTNAVTVAGIISGTNTLTINTGSNAGTVIFSNAANSYTGNTTINGGTLQIGSAGTLGSGSYAGNVSIASNSTFKYSSSATQTLSGAISGAGTLTKDTGTATLTISNPNTLFAGAVNVNAGTLAISDANALGGSSGGLVTVGAAGTLDLQYAGTITLSSLVMGSGAAVTNSTTNSALTIAGTTTLSGAVTTNGLQTYTGAALLGANTTLTTTTAPVTFGSTVDSVSGSNYSLTVSNGSGTNTFTGAVGGTTPLSAISVSGASSLLGSVTTNGTSGQLWSGNLTIAGNLTLSSNNGPVTINGTVTTLQLQNILQFTGSGAYSDTVNGVVATGTAGSSAITLPSGGGTLSYASGTGIYTWTAPANIIAQYLVVAGGGAGGGALAGGGGSAGGGGGGGVIAGNFVDTTSLTFTASVGAGGSGFVDNHVNGNGSGVSGASSTLTQSTLSLSATAIGGGGGGQLLFTGSSGGSGGGGGGANVSQTKAGGAGTINQGNAGGSGTQSAAGGGGGAGGAGGGNASTNNGGNGGDGLASSITGTTVYYGAGGGGSSTGYGGSGGQGGGGNGGGSVSLGTNGSGYGSGGGGTSMAASGGGSGTSGIVIVSYSPAYAFAINAGSGKVLLTNDVNSSAGNSNSFKSITITSSNATNAISGNIYGSSSLVFNGTGTLKLSGSNTYTGGTTIAGGILAISSDVNLGSIPTTVTPASITLSGGALQAIGASGEVAPTIVTLNANRGITVSSASGLAASTITTGSAVYVDVLSIPGVITGAGALTINGAGQGGTVLFTNTANSYGTTSLTTATTITAGILGIVADGSLGTLPSAVQAASIKLNGGTLEAYGASTEGSATTVTLNANRGITLGATSGGLAATSNTNYVDTLVVNGIVTGSSSYSLTVNSSAQGGTVDLTAVNVYAGNTTISGGTLQIGGSGSLNTASYGGSISIAAGAVLEYSSSTTQNFYGGITGAGSIVKDTSVTSDLALSIQNANSNYSGGTVIKAGSVDLYSAYSAGTGTITLGDTVSGTNAVNLNVINATTFANPIVLNPYGVLTVSNRYTYNGAGYYPIYTGGITGNNNLIIAGVSGGSMTFTTNPINISGTITSTTAAWGVTPVSITAGIGSNVTGIIQNGGAPLAISGILNVNSNGTTLTDTSGTMTITGGVAGTGNLILNNNTTTASSLTISSAAINNVGTVTNSGNASGATLISGGVGSNVTNIIQNSSTSALNITTTAITVGATTTLKDMAGTLTVSGGVAGTGNLVLNNNSNTANGITLSTTNVNNTGTITNSGTGSGNSLISIAIGTANTGVIQNSGSSALILTGTNLYTNGTTITSGTLQIGTGGTAGSLGSGPLSNSGNLTFNLSSALNFGSGLTGTGSVTQNGSGALTLSGNNTYSGGTYIGASSKIIVTSANALGGSSGGTVNIGSSGILDLQYAGTITLTSLVMASGSSITNSTSGTTNSGLTVSGTSTLLGTVTTYGAQTYTGAVLVGGATTLNSTSGGVTFSSTLASSATLTEVVQFLGAGAYNFAGTTGTATGAPTTFNDGSTISYNSATGVYTFFAGTSASSQYLVVGGGGGGTRGVSNIYWGAGAGGGAVLTGTTSLVAGTSYSVTVGAGGAGQTKGTPPQTYISASQDPAATSTASSGYNGGNGGTSTFVSISAAGGLGAVANNGASGSASGNGNLGGVGSAAPYPYVQSSVCSLGSCGVGGGGGAGGAGTATAGGPGVSSSITGSTITYGAGGCASIGGNCASGTLAPNTGAGAGDINATPSQSGSSGIVALSIPNAITTTSLTINAGAGAISMAGNVKNLNLTLNSNSASSSISGVVSGAVSLTYNNGSGYTTAATPVLVLSNANTYSGGTTVITGSLQAGTATSYGLGAITVGSGVNSLGSIDVHGYAVSNAITVYGGGVLGAIANNGSSSVTLSNAITVGSAFSLGGGR